MPIRLSGMVSGLDTDSVVKALMSAQTYKKTKIEASKQKLEWKKELWADMNTKIYDFYKSSLSKMRMQSTFKTKTASSSDSSKITATAGSNAAEGTYRVKVNSVASAQYVTSGKLKNVVTNEDGTTTEVVGKDKNGKAITTSTKLTDLYGGEAFETDTQIKFTANNGKKEAVLNVDQYTTVGDFVTAARSVGLNASYDTTQNRFFISSTSSGSNQKFTIQAETLGQQQANAVTSWKNLIGYDALSETDRAEVNKIFNGLQLGTTTYDDNTIGTKLSKYCEKAYVSKLTTYIKGEIQKDYENKYFTKDSEGNITATTDAARMALEDAGQTVPDGLEERKKAVSALITTKLKEDMKSTEVAKTAVNVAKRTGLGAADLEIKDGNGTLKWTIPKVDSDDFLAQSFQDKVTKLKAAANTYHEAIQNGSTSNSNSNSNALEALGLGNIDGSTRKESETSSGMVVIAASNASIEFNGATLESSNSTLSVNGLTLNILDESDNDVTITVNKDVSSVYDSVKDFISEYNTILKSMNTSYNMKKAKGYDVLTDEMKEGMTDDEVEKWEALVKSSLLRKDDTLNSLISSFQTNMMTTYTASDGKKYSLASLGIMTSRDYTEKGLLHIMGDEDDTVYADSENKLQKMLDKNPDLVMEIMNGITNNLYQDLTKKMRSTTYSSALTFYNDKQMTKQVDQYKKDITTWEKKLSEMEERYYKQFSAMEKAMSNLQSQQNTLSGFFG